MRLRRLQQDSCNQVLSPECSGNSSGRKDNKPKNCTKSWSDIFWPLLSSQVVLRETFCLQDIPVGLGYGNSLLLWKVSWKPGGDIK